MTSASPGTFEAMTGHAAACAACTTRGAFSYHYGAEPLTVAPGRYLAQYGLVPGTSCSWAGWSPRNCAITSSNPFRGLVTDFRCVVVGDTPYAAAYINERRAITDPRLVFTGYLFGEGYRELAGNATVLWKPPRSAAPIRPSWKRWRRSLLALNGDDTFVLFAARAGHWFYRSLGYPRRLCVRAVAQHGSVEFSGRSHWQPHASA